LGGEVIVVGADVDLAVLEPLARRPEPLGLLVDELLAATDGDDDGAIHGDDVNRAIRAVFVGVVAR
jgi:hypothetical protein